MRARLAVRVHSAAIGELEGFVRMFAADHGIAADDQARMRIMLEELLTNLSKYGYPDRNEREGLAEVNLELAGNQLVIEFGDDGQAFDPLAKASPDLEQSIRSRPVGGLGLHIVRALADEAQYSRRDDRNVIRLSRRVSLIKSAGP